MGGGAVAQSQNFCLGAWPSVGSAVGRSSQVMNPGEGGQRQRLPGQLMAQPSGAPRAHSDSWARQSPSAEWRQVYY